MNYRFSKGKPNIGESVRIEGFREVHSIYIIATKYSRNFGEKIFLYYLLLYSISYDKSLKFKNIYWMSNGIVFTRLYVVTIVKLKKTYKLVNHLKMSINYDMVTLKNINDEYSASL